VETTPTTDIWGIRAPVKLFITPSENLPWRLRLSEPVFAEVKQENQNRLDKALRKVSLRFADGNLDVENRERRKEVLMKERVKTGMPTTTNSLEKQKRDSEACG
jgi:hypothetical protein